MNVKRLVLLGMGGSIAGVLMSVGGATWIEGGTPASARVEVRQEGTSVGTQAPGDALQAASAQVGFEVLPLSNLPNASLALKFVDAHTGPGGTSNALRYAVVGYEGALDGPQMTVSQFNVHMAHPANDAAERLDIGIPTVEVWKSVGNDVTVYTILTRSRTYDLIVSGMPELSTSELAKLAASLK